MELNTGDKKNDELANPSVSNAGRVNLNERKEKNYFLEWSTIFVVLLLLSIDYRLERSDMQWATRDWEFVLNVTSQIISYYQFYIYFDYHREDLEKEFNRRLRILDEHQERVLELWWENELVCIYILS